MEEDVVAKTGLMVEAAELKVKVGFSCVSLDVASTRKSSGIELEADARTLLVASTTRANAANLGKSPVASSSGRAPPSGVESTEGSKMAGLSTPKPTDTEQDAVGSKPKNRRGRDNEGRGIRARERQAQGKRRG